MIPRRTKPSGLGARSPYWLLLAALLLVGGPAWAQQPAARRVALDLPALRRQLAPPPAGAAARRAGPPPAYRLRLPTLAGPGLEEFVLTETHVLPAADAAAGRRLRTFVGYAAAHPDREVALALQPGRVQADLLGGPAPATLAPDPAGGYRLRPAPPTPPAACGVTEAMQRAALGAEAQRVAQPAPYSFGTQLRTLQLAILVTLEYYNAHGRNDADVEAAVVAALNSISLRYHQELSLSWQLVHPLGEPTYYFSAMTTATLGNGSATQSGRLRYQQTGDVDALVGARFGAANYDVGHCFHNSGGGIAPVRAVCGTGKGGGWSGVTNGGFQLTLAHELGHQLGAVHTFSGNCGDYGADSQVEPGGGASIMSYAQVCGAQTLSGLGDPTAFNYFNALSLRQIRNMLTGVSCPTTTANANQVPTVSAGADYTIPKGTPFVLTASGSDPDGNPLRYTWDQADYSPNNLKALGTAAGDGGLAAIDDPEAPLFRPRLPRTIPARTFPDLAYVLNNNNQPPNQVGEALANVTRDIHFTVTARDLVNAGGTYATDNVTVHVEASGGPFRVTAQNSRATALWLAGQPQGHGPVAGRPARHHHLGRGRHHAGPVQYQPGAPAALHRRGRYLPHGAGRRHRQRRHRNRRHPGRPQYHPGAAARRGGGQHLLRHQQLRLPHRPLPAASHAGTSGHGLECPGRRCQPEPERAALQHHAVRAAHGHHHRQRPHHQPF